MPSTTRQKPNARSSGEVDLLSYFDNIDVVLGDEISNPIEG